MQLDQLNAIKTAFVQELADATAGNKTSLPFIRHTLTSRSLVAQNEIFQTLVIGGSIFQKAVMQKVDDNIKIIVHTQGEQPKFLTKQHLMDFVISHLEPEVKTIALNFAYPMTPISRGDVLDGTLQNGSKENTFEGLVGQNVGEEIEKYIKETQGRDVQISIANDTICLMLSGLIQHPWNKLAAGIVGTGLNFAMYLDENTAVNLESGSFDKFTPSEAGIDIDIHSAAPKDAIFEKEISGAYLFKHFNFLAQKRGIAIEPISSSQQLDNLVNAPSPEIAALAQEILLNSASLVAIQVAGIMEFCKRDLVFIMQGSLYWKGNKYKDTIEKLVIEMCPQHKASYENVFHSDLLGAAKLVA
ncbi:hypothetical protein BH09PAT2_BH09PAT2_02270 [soil metagenome]